MKLVKDNKLHLGCSPLIGNVYLGKQNKDCWIGEPRDVTSEFIQVMQQKFNINTTQTIRINGNAAYRVIVVDMDKEVLINGKNVNDQ